MATFTGPDLANLNIVVNTPMAAINAALRFTEGESSPSTYALMQFGAATFRTLANGAGVAANTLNVDSSASIAPGDYITIGANPRVQVLIVSDDGVSILLKDAQSWADNATINEVAISAHAITDVTLASDGSSFSGTPTVIGTHPTVFIRSTAPDTLFDDSNAFDYTVSAAPNPPVFSGAVDSNDFLVGGGTKTVDYGANFTLVTTYAVRPGDPALPATFSIHPTTGILTCLDTVAATWTGRIRGTNSDGFADSNFTTQSMGFRSIGIDGNLPVPISVAGTITVNRARRVTDAIRVPLTPASDISTTSNLVIAGTVAVRIRLEGFSLVGHGIKAYSLVGLIPARITLNGAIVYTQAPAYVGRSLFEFPPDLRLYTFNED